jgi:UPF0716 protein FxsA
MAPTVSYGAGGPARPVRRGRWPLLLVLLLLVVPLLEVVVIIAVGRAIGGWPTFALLLAESAFGAWLVRHEGARAWASLQEALTTGRMPSRQLSDAALVLVGGVLLLAPGFLTDIVGFFLVLPFTRPMARRLLEAVVARRLLAGVYAGGVTPQDPRGGSRPASRSAAADDVIEGEIL